MKAFASQWNAGGEQAQQRTAATLQRIAALRELEQRAADASQRMVDRCSLDELRPGADDGEEGAGGLVDRAT